MAMTTAVHDPEAMSGSAIEWGPVVAGALVAAALGSVAIAFGGAVGLSLTSPWPGSGISLWATLIFVTYWSVLIQILSFAAGGYLAARLRTRASSIAVGDRQFSDGAHGLLMWAVGVLMMALLVAFGSTIAASTASRLAAGTAAGTGAAMSGGSGPAASLNPADFAVASLLRPVPGATPPATGGTAADDTLLRADLARTFGSVIRNRELTVRDRDYLAQVVSSRTGASQDDARRRVTEAVNEARDLEIKARAAADTARKSAVLAGFTAAAALLIGLAAACAAGVCGGRHRDDNVPVNIWGRPIW
jgi:hypothetical protein